MISRVHSSILQGIDAVAGEVEADVARGGLGELKLVGLAETAVKESISRIQAALRNSGYRWPGPKVTINLAPADVRKDSAAFDLPIALAVMQAGAMFSGEFCDDFLVVGELALDGRVRAVKGALATAMLARRLGKRGLICPVDNAAEAAVVEGIEVIGVNFLAQAVGFLTGELPIEPSAVDLTEVFRTAGRYDVDFADVRGQESAKRALTIAAAGHHNILMIGPPGAGKTMLAKRIPTILPPLTTDESLETTRIYSARGLLEPGQSLMAVRPVRMPHHSTSSAALVGGGIIPQPGEISLAHHGVLFLDELPEFTPHDAGDGPPASRGRLRYDTPRPFHAEIPCRNNAVAAMNPCPCGYFTDPKRPCKCSPMTIERYLSRISGPMIDRIDIHIEVPPVPWRQLRGDGDGLSSEEMLRQVVNARGIQRRRFSAVSNADGGGECENPSPRDVPCGTQSEIPKGQVRNTQSSIVTNATMSSRQVRRYCKLDQAGETILKQAMTELGLSARAHDKVLRIARTIADMDGEENIQSQHLAEAVQYRKLDRRL